MLDVLLITCGWILGIGISSLVLGTICALGDVEKIDGEWYLMEDSGGVVEKFERIMRNIIGS